MARETIDIGIDLGTTNSSVACWGGDGQIEVFKNQDQSHSTPSAVYQGRRGLQVGIRAKDQMKVDPENVQTEFKQQMGRKTKYTFPTSGMEMLPEELSAEVLKSLKGDVMRRLNEDIRAAVITIPAAFERTEIHATNEAARLAGFDLNPLCLEPVAASLAYSQKHKDKDGFWMVFDFGGGTFDSAIVKLQDEEFQLVNHHGDNQLGGKLIDWALMDGIVIPAVQKEFNVNGFSRHSKDPMVRSSIAKLKLATEKAKVLLSTEEKSWIEVDNLVVGEGSESHLFELELRRSDVDRLAEPFIVRAVNLCRKAITEKRLTPADISQLILVGGPTQMPIFREMLSDGNMGLGIPLEFSVDPMTVVAQGAAIFARSQRLEAPKIKNRKPQVEGAIEVKLEYKPTGSDPEPVIAGALVTGERTSFGGFTIEFRNARWTSGRIRVAENGAFMTQLVAVDGGNTYEIHVCDPTGTDINADPDRISYHKGPSFAEIPLNHGIAVAKADNTVDPIFEKGMALPVRKMRTYSQVSEVIAGEEKSEVRIPLVEGSHQRADRNILIGCLIVKGTQIKRNIPAGMEVEFTLTIDTSQRLTVSAEIPVIGETFEKAFDLTRPEIETSHVRDDAKAQLKRFDDLTKKAESINDAKANQALERITSEKILEEVNAALDNLGTGGDANDLLLNRLRDLKIALDEVESALEWPRLVQKAADDKKWAEKKVNESEHATFEHTSAMKRLARDYQHALDSENADLLRRVSEEYDDIYREIAQQEPSYWVGFLQQLEESKGEMSDQSLATDLFSQGRRSIDNNDVDGLRSSVRQLAKLLPRDKVEKIGLGATVM
jgi:molecular chaperone DnaK